MLIHVGRACWTYWTCGFTLIPGCSGPFSRTARTSWCGRLSLYICTTHDSVLPTLSALCCGRFTNQQRADLGRPWPIERLQPCSSSWESLTRPCNPRCSQSDPLPICTHSALTTPTCSRNSIYLVYPSSCCFTLHCKCFFHSPIEPICHDDT